MHRLRPLALLPLLLATVLFATPAAADSTPPPNDLNGVGLAPAHYDPNNPATKSYFIPTLNPGQTFSDAVIVDNPTARTLNLRVYPVDGLTSPYSGAVYSSLGDPLRRAGQWVTPGTTTITVAPKSTFNIPFSVTPPAGIDPGDHLAGLAVQDVNQAPSSAAGGVGVNVVVRLVMGILVKVPGAASFNLAIHGATISTQPGIDSAFVIVDATNTGKLLGHPHLHLDLSGPNGYHRALDHQLDTVLPTDTIKFPFPWPDTLRDGDYTIAITATGDGMPTATWTGTYHLGQTLAGTTASGPAAIVVTSSNTLLIVLLAVVGGLLLVLILLVLWLAVLRPRRRVAAPAEPTEERRSA